ncbi:PCD1 [[Candida] subhashii]|uniref:PCD1 n=1 Tax=[Candida] subhashii TaxID=561895 RepID=A0A8J5QUL9_9ASCO|nr:PCD1 [[Candida] subhashii]KAG7666353.1 PCD1 [[Candida] subhashii]
MTKYNEITLLENIRNYLPVYYQNQSHSIWHKLPVSRRSAVFVLLFLGNLGELRVILTKRSSKLRSFPGHISLPGGKADSSQEDEWTVSRREMHEEIGLSSNNSELLAKHGFQIDHLNVLPSYLSRTFSAVRPCIGFMNFQQHNDLIKHLNLQLNPGESSSIFSCPLRDFLYPIVDETPLESLERVSYKVKWGGIPWDLRSYTFLQNSEHEVEWLKDIKDLSCSEEESELDLRLGDELDSIDKGRVTPPNIIPKVSKKKNLQKWGRLGARKDEMTQERIYDVWGLTANILHDLAEIVYLGGTERHIGSEEMIYGIHEFGNQMKERKRSDEEIKLIHATHTEETGFGFNSLLPDGEFNRLKTIYKF